MSNTDTGDWLNQFFALLETKRLQAALAHHIKTERERQNLKPYQLASKTDISSHLIQTIETSSYLPSIEELNRILNTLQSNIYNAFNLPQVGINPRYPVITENSEILFEILGDQLQVIGIDNKKTNIIDSRTLKPYKTEDTQQVRSLSLKGQQSLKSQIHLYTRWMPTVEFAERFEFYNSIRTRTPSLSYAIDECLSDLGINSEIQQYLSNILITLDIAAPFFSKGASNFKSYPLRMEEIRTSILNEDKGMHYIYLQTAIAQDIRDIWSSYAIAAFNFNPDIDLETEIREKVESSRKILNTLRTAESGIKGFALYLIQIPNPFNSKHESLEYQDPAEPENNKQFQRTVTLNPNRVKPQTTPSHQPTFAEILTIYARNFAEDLKENISAETLAKDIYQVCRWMQDNKKHFNCQLSSLEDSSDKKGLQLHTYWMIPESGLIEMLSEIIFYSGKPSSGSNFHSWGLRRNPVSYGKNKKEEIWLWELRWYEIFKNINTEISRKIEKRLHQHKREHGNDWLEQKSSLQIAQMRAVSELMTRWLWETQWAANADRSGDILAWLRSIWLAQAEIMSAELQYRLYAEPQERKTVKQTQAAQEDFNKARELLKKGTTAIYSKDFIEMVEKTAFPFDFSIDEEYLPKSKPDKAPIMRMSLPELMDEFIRWVSSGEIDPNSFEGEDARLLKEQLHQTLARTLDESRKILARAKGQKVESQKITKNENQDE